MKLTLIQGPAEPVVTVEQARAHMRVDTVSTDDTITRLIASATAYLDGRDGILGRALRPQQWRLEMSRFPACFRLPLPPTISVDEITYIDTAGDEQIIPSTDYRVIPGGWDGDEIRPIIGGAWPLLYAGEPDAARVVFTAGYIRENSPQDEAIPENIRTAVLMMVQAIYDNPQLSEIPEVIFSLIAPLRVVRVG